MSNRESLWVYKERQQAAVRKSTVAKFKENIARKNLPNYEVEMTRSHGNIHTITARPITTGANNFNLGAAQENLGAFLRSYILTEISARTGWRPQETVQRVRGHIQVTNLINPASTRISTLDRLGDINPQFIEDVFESMKVSDTEIPFEHLEWTIVINPSVYFTGAGTELSLVRKGLGWTTYYDTEGPINCAAIALTILTRPNQFDRQIELLKK